MSKCILFNNKKRCLPGAYSVIGKREYSPEISGGIVDPEPPEEDVKDALLLVDKISFLTLFIKENSDRCHYYNGKWNKKDLILGCSSILIGLLIKQFLL